MFDRSFHFVPADRPEYLKRINELNADAYIIDLEDSVPQERKKTALENVNKLFEKFEFFKNLYIRVNDCENCLLEEEANLIAKYNQFGIVLPKVSSADKLNNYVDIYNIENGRPLIILIESASALLEIQNIIKIRKLRGIGLGLEDFFAKDIFSQAERKILINKIRTEIVLNARSDGIMAIDAVSTDLYGGPELQKSIVEARQSGMTAKFSIHPNQVDLINEGFTPSADTMLWAKDFSTTFKDCKNNIGYARIDNEIISPPKHKKSLYIKEFIDYHGI